ncbi:GTP pyrophosphokinase family protein [Gordonia terrae]|uniref:GTP pyrophosphokinase n=1 Tax=Gordonia terrae TaxID=2055 RepID=UPI00200B3D61|nr:GTP pyrophosphokinase family protein [Gordonia terrae]UPW11343.1 GTP pyrophosphokinase family protein [Gordonia terrae]
MTAGDSDSPTDREILGDLARLRGDMTRFQMEHQFAVDEILTKVTILRTEFLHLHHYNPIEHVTSRVKTPESILRKAMRKGIAPDLPTIRSQLTDIAGIRVTCSFIADTYRILETLTSHDDIRVIEIKDYIAAPKPNGYKSLHAIVAIPVFLSTGPVEVVVEIQIRTVAMDFWASLEHKIFYKYDGRVPDHLSAELASAARTANELDQRMERLHAEVHGDGPDSGRDQIDDDVIRYLRQHSSWPEVEEGRPEAR